MGRGSPAQSCSHRLLLRDFHKLHLQVDTSRCCSGDLRAQRAQRGENAAQRPTSHAFPTLDPAGGILGAPRSAGGGQAAPESQAPRTVLRAGHLNPAQRNGARDAQRRARGHTASQRPARPLIQFRFCHAAGGRQSRAPPLGVGLEAQAGVRGSADRGGRSGQSCVPAEAGVTAEYAAVPAAVERLKEHRGATREPPCEALHAAAVLGGSMAVDITEILPGGTDDALRVETLNAEPEEH
ncbi:unnamed protein product [Rangifer tarandus platyrhynchus]|uniref:Uncharacterized protein n=1 Tax=Rangifer tarandus platyrhynchus TaxID=3082113 RepID=A0AC59ZPS6_RANTA